MSSNDLSKIRALSITSDLTDEELDTLCDVMQHRVLKDGDILLTEGDTDHVLFGIASGRLEAVKDTGMGDHITLQVFKPGDIVGELGFLDGNCHCASIISVGQSEVLSLERDVLEGMLDEHPKLVYSLMRGIIRSVHAILTRMNLQYAEMNNYISKQHGRY